MGSWIYGLVELEQEYDEGKYGELTLCEVYFHKSKKPYMFQPIDWKDAKRDKKLIIKDIISQLKVMHMFKAKKEKDGRWKMWKVKR